MAIIKCPFKKSCSAEEPDKTVKGHQNSSPRAFLSPTQTLEAAANSERAATGGRHMLFHPSSSPSQYLRVFNSINKEFALEYL